MRERDRLSLICAPWRASGNWPDELSLFRKKVDGKAW